MQHDKPGLAALIIGRIKKKEQPEESDYSVKLEAAMDDFLAAVEDKDTKRMGEAFKDAMDICDDDEAESEESEDDLEE